MLATGVGGVVEPSSTPLLARDPPPGGAPRSPRSAYLEGGPPSAPVRLRAARKRRASTASTASASAAATQDAATAAHVMQHVVMMNTPQWSLEQSRFRFRIHKAQAAAIAHATLAVLSRSSCTPI